MLDILQWNTETKPKDIAIDFETSLHKDDGTIEASTEAYRHDFRVDSMAITWSEGDNLVSRFYQGEDIIRTVLSKIAELQIPVIIHNLQYEMLCVYCRFPELYTKLNWYADTMRLVQNYDNGGDENSYETIILDDDLLDIEDSAELLERMESGVKRELVSGLGLVKCLKRIFKGQYKDHKHEAYSWLRSNGIREGQEGANLHLLPVDILERYNVADTENTYKLYKHCVDFFKSIDFDWTVDHRLFKGSVDLFVRAKVKGILVSREPLALYIKEIKQEIDQIGQNFLDQHAEAIALVEQDRLNIWCDIPKTEKGKAKRRSQCAPGSENWEKYIKFNPGSNKQLQAVFMDKLGITPKFFTEKGNPSFKSAVLGQWGTGGELLMKRRKRLIVMKQAESLYALSAYDGIWRPDVRVAATATGRAASGSGG